MPRTVRDQESTACKVVSPCDEYDPENAYWDTSVEYDPEIPELASVVVEGYDPNKAVYEHHARAH